MQIIVRDNNVEQALRALKKKLQREGVYREMKLRRHYEKPSEKRARERAAAIRRARKLERKRAEREGADAGRRPLPFHHAAAPGVRERPHAAGLPRRRPHVRGSGAQGRSRWRPADGPATQSAAAVRFRPRRLPDLPPHSPPVAD